MMSNSATLRSYANAVRMHKQCYKHKKEHVLSALRARFVL